MNKELIISKDQAHIEAPIFRYQGELKIQGKAVCTFYFYDYGKDENGYGPVTFLYDVRGNMIAQITGAKWTVN